MCSESNKDKCENDDYSLSTKLESCCSNKVDMYENDNSSRTKKETHSDASVENVELFSGHLSDQNELLAKEKDHQSNEGKTSMQDRIKRFERRTET